MMERHVSAKSRVTSKVHQEQRCSIWGALLALQRRCEVGFECYMREDRVRRLSSCDEWLLDSSSALRVSFLPHLRLLLPSSIDRSLTRWCSRYLTRSPCAIQANKALQNCAQPTGM